MWCAIGIILLIASLVMIYYKEDDYNIRRFQALLDEDQTIIYNNIVRERAHIYTKGMILGVVLGFWFYIKQRNRALPLRICALLGIILTSKIVTYTIHPKPPLMLHSLTSKEQVEAWATIYTQMKNRWIKSLGVGLIAYLCLAIYLR